MNPEQNQDPGAEAQAQAPESSDETVTISKEQLETLKKNEETLGSLKRDNKKLERKVEELSQPKQEAKGEEDVPSSEPEASKVDFGQLAFHNSKTDSTKIEHQEDIAYLKEAIEDTGKSQAEILESKWFIAELKDRQDNRSAKEATPSSTRGSSEAPQKNADYWVKKGELPPDVPENRELRREVVNLRMKNEKHGSKFADASVVNG